MKHQAYSHSAIGKQKEQNQDALLVDPALSLYMVCDGIGGRAAGNVASITTCTLMRQSFGSHSDVLKAYRKKGSTTHRQQANMVVKSVVESVNKEIHLMGQRNERFEGMASTLTMVMILGRNALVAHAGDSRVYLIREKKAYLLTDDHSVAKTQLNRGLISAEDALHGSHSSTVTRAIGMSDRLEPDLLNLELMPGDKFLLCTDGLSRYITTEEIAKIAGSGKTEKLAERLVEIADRRAGKDNITAVVVEIDPDQKVAGLNAKQKIEAIKKIPLFQGLTFPEAIRVLSVVSSRSYKKSERLITQGKHGREFYVGVFGKFRVEIDGHPVTELPPGSLIGEGVLLSDEPHQADVFAVDDAHVMVIDREDFFNLLRNTPYLANKFLWSFCRVLNERLRHTGQRYAKLRYEGETR
jgi:serine/threonine protein phosphatase PrpC